MIYSIKTHPEFKIIDYFTKEKIAGARLVDLKNLLIQIYNYDTEEIVEKKLAFGGCDIDERLIWVGLIE